jgi:hypothetical protein
VKARANFTSRGARGVRAWQTAPLAGSFEFRKFQFQERRPNEFFAGTKRKANGRNA